MQKFIFIGRLTKDVEVRTTQNDKNVSHFSVAVRRPYSKEETDFFDVSAWGNLGENCAKYLGKGSQVGVQGYMISRTYEDSNGIKRKVFEVRAEEVEFLTPKQTNESNEPRKSLSQLQAEIDDGFGIPF